MSNTNCLAGMQCPRCGSLEPFRVEIKPILLTFFDSGSSCDQGFDTEWDDDSYCECLECNFSGAVRDFQGAIPAA